MQQEDKYLVDRTKRNKSIRNILLLSTIGLFVAFLIFFISSFIQYRSIQSRIERIYSSINTDQTSFVTLLTKFNDAENHFRQYSLNYDSTDFLEYNKNLMLLRASVDSLRKVREVEEIVDQKYRSDSVDYSRLLPMYIDLAANIDSLMQSARTLDEFHRTAINNSMFNLPQENSIANSDLSRSTPNVIINRKPLLQRIFQPKRDTLTLGSDLLSQDTRNMLHQSFSRIRSESDARAQGKLDEIKLQLTDLRQKERLMLSDNFTLLHKTNQQIRYVYDQRIKFQREKSDQELNVLLANTDTFKWQIIISLTFVFIVICILVYYQFFTNYYEQMLMDEKIYASKLAEQKTDILAEITHEIRTPINSMIGIVDLLRSRNDLYQPKDILLLETAYSNITATSKTINDILNLSKIDKHDTIEPNHFDFHDMLLEILDNYRNQASLKKITLNHSLDETKPTIIFTDELKVRQVVSNLVSNAIKYSSQGTVTTKMYVNNHSNLVIKVSDEGNGIPENLKKNIFKKYYTENKTNKVEGGVGLGLYITKNIVTLLKGKI